MLGFGIGQGKSYPTIGLGESGGKSYEGSRPVPFPSGKKGAAAQGINHNMVWVKPRSPGVVRTAQFYQEY